MTFVYWLKDRNALGIPRWRHLISLPSFWVGLIAIGYVAIQLATMDLNRFLDWDEAIYVSEVSRVAEPIGLSAHRARGISFLIWPFAQISDSLVGMRIYLMMVSVVGFWGAYRLWVPVVGRATLFGAGLFGFTWIAAFYGSDVSPNLFSALLVVAAVGATFRVIEVPKTSGLLLVALLVAGVALMRPVDAVAVACSIILITFVANRRSTVKSFLWTCGGFIVGMLPWVVEAFVTYGGPLQRLQEAASIVGGGITNNTRELVELLDGPLVGPDRSDLVGTPPLVWLTMLIGGSIAGPVAGSSHNRKVGWLTLSAAGISALPYMFGAEALAARFLLPSISLLTMSTGIGTWSIVERSRSKARLLIALLVLTASMVWSWPTLLELSAQQSHERQISLALGRAVKERMPDNCFFLSEYGFPQISFASGCPGEQLTADDDATQRALREAARNGSTPALIFYEEIPGDVPGSTWSCDGLNSPLLDDWQVCTQ